MNGPRLPPWPDLSEPAVQHGLKTTFEVLSKTRNEAAVAVLVPALDSPHRWIQEEAYEAILKHPSPAGHRVVLARLHELDDRLRQIVTDHRSRMTTALRDSILSFDRQICSNGCQAIESFREYDLIPALINAAEDQANPNADLAAGTITELAEHLYGELANKRDYRNRRDPALVRRHVVSSLERSVKRFSKHKCQEVIEAFLTLANRDNVTLKQILGDPHHGSYLAVVDTLTHSPRVGVMRLLLGYLEEPHTLSAAITVLAHRGDEKFLGYLLNKIGYEPSPVAIQNLKRIQSIVWLQEQPSVLDALDDASQHAAVQMLMASGTKRLEAFKVIRYLLVHGKTGGRRAAAAVLAEFSGAEPNDLALQTLDDPDPQVQAHALSQLRQRGIPGAISRLIELADSPHVLVQQAAREQLEEFSFPRFLATFDMLDDRARESTGLLVAKIDPDSTVGLIAEMEGQARSRRLRAASMASAMGLASQLEEPLLNLLQDEDHMVRSEAATSLVHCNSPAVFEALSQALEDRSISVQEAAKSSLEQLAKCPAPVPVSSAAYEAAALEAISNPPQESTR